MVYCMRIFLRKENTVSYTSAIYAKRYGIVAAVSMAAVSILGSVSAAQAVTITDVTARQRWPWNSLVDVGFRIAGGKEGEAFAIDITAEYDGGKKKLAAYTYLSEPIAGAGSNSIVWDMGADYPDFHADDMTLYVTATPLSDTTPVYMVIDLAAGPDAEKYPVRYTTKAPVIHHPDEDLQAALSDKCRTTEMWFRRIPAAGSLSALTWRKPEATDDDSKKSAFWIKLTKDFYFAIFETTQQQWYQLTGEWPSNFSNETYRAVRPLEMVTVADLRGQWLWPDDKSITEDSVLKKLRDRTGLNTIDLPTLAQHNYATCAGDSGTGASRLYRYRDESGAILGLNEIARYSANSGKAANLVTSLCDLTLGSACVGSYKPNLFGIYDTIGNIYEICLDAYMSAAARKAYYYPKDADGNYIETDWKGNPVIDPVGPTQQAVKDANNTLKIIYRNGSWYHSDSYCNLWQHSGLTPTSSSSYIGFRLAVTCE